MHIHKKIIVIEYIHKMPIHDDTLSFQVPTNYSLGVVMALGALVCWGSWSVTLVLATSKALRDPFL